MTARTRAASPVEAEPQATPEPTAEEVDDNTPAPSVQTRTDPPPSPTALPGVYDPFACPHCRVLPGFAHLPTCTRPDVASDVLRAEPVVVLLSRAMGEVGAIAKDRQITEGGQRYAFRGIEDVQQRLQPILVRHGLVILPTTLERIDHPVRTTARGTSMYAVALHVRFTVYGPAGDSLAMDAWGEGVDTGDKSSGKAHSMAFKTAMLEAFCVPTELDTPDADRDQNPDDTFTDVMRERAARAWEAALQAGTEPALAGVRGRATEVLRVPVHVEGRGVMPLDEALVGRLQYVRAQTARQGQGDTGAGGSGGEQS